MSKRDVLNALATINFTEDIVMGDTVVTPDDIKDFIETSIAQLDKRAETAAKRSNAKKAAGDELRANIKAIITDSPKNIREIVRELDDENVASAMVVSRLTQLIKLGEAFKKDTRVDGRSIKIYSTTPFNEDEE